MAENRWLFIHPFQLRLMRGIETYLWNLSVALIDTGLAVDILTWDGPLDIPDYAQKPDIRIHRVPDTRYFQSAAAVPFYLQRILSGNYAHVFTHFAGYGEGLSLRLAHLLRPVEFSVVAHFPPSLVPYRYREFERWGFKRNAKHLIAVSEATAREVEHWAERSCSAIGHGVDTSHFRPDSATRALLRSQAGIYSDAHLLISAAALEERKGIQWVLQALPGVLEKMPNTHYWILGDGPFRAALEEQVSRLQLQKVVTFWGFQQDVAPYLAASDIALLLSYGEASPISLLEFAAAGLPVITSQHEPFPELIGLEWGQMVPEKDADAVSLAILSLLDNDSLKTNQGRSARNHVFGHHQWSQIAEQYRDLIG